MKPETARFVYVAVLLLAILAVAYKPKLLPFIAVGGFLVIYGPVAIGRVQSWNVFHYWLNTKYLQEVGFTDLYNCAYEVTPEKLAPFSRNLNNYHYQLSRELPPCPRKNFSEARWQSFKEDLLWLEARPARKLIWSGVLRDKGLNTTPTWLAFAEPLANAFPVGSVGWWGLLYLDFILLVAALLFIGFVRGSQVASLMAIFLLAWVGTAPQLMGHWFQYVWLTLCIVSVGAWHKKWYALSGGALALAAALRIFPAVLFIWPVLHWRKVSRRFWSASIVIFGVTAVLGSFTSLGVGIWPKFIDKMIRHSNHIVIEPGNFGLRNMIAAANNPAGAMATWEAFALGKLSSASFPSPPAWAWLAVAIMAILAAIAAMKQKEMSFSSGLPFLFSGLVVSRYYYGGMIALVFDDATQEEAIVLLTISLVFLVLLYWLHPVIGYTVGQFTLLCYVYWKVNKWT